MTRKTDPELQTAVLRELKWDTRIEETDVGVSVDSGVVTLSGTVKSWAERVAAEEATHRVQGVLDVANDLVVKIPGSPGRTDTQIAHAVRHALEWDVFVPETRIHTTVSNGWVTLEGDVDLWNQREDAERAIRNLTGVQGVVNKIEIRPQAYAADIQRSIESALERRAQREAARVQVEIKDGRASLSGSVHSWAEKQAVLGAARGTPGVRSVADHIRIVHGA